MLYLPKHEEGQGLVLVPQVVVFPDSPLQPVKVDPLLAVAVI